MGITVDKKARLLNCIDNKPIDRVPFAFWHHFFGADAQGKACIEAHKRIYEAADMDFIKMNSNGFYPIDFGTEIHRPSDWAAIRPPTPGSDYFKGQIDRVRWMIDAIHDEACVYYVVFAAYSFLCQRYGEDVCDAALRDDETRKYLLPALDRVGDFVAELCEALVREGGATGIFEAFSSCGRFSVEEYRQWIRPQDEKQMRACDAVSGYNIVHLCGGHGRNNYAAWYDYSGAVVHWDQHNEGIPIEEGRLRFPNRRAIMAGFDNRPGAFLYTQSEARVKEMTKAYARAGGDTGFILTADCTLSADVPYERLRWVGEALKEIGQ